MLNKKLFFFLLGLSPFLTHAEPNCNITPSWVKSAIGITFSPPYVNKKTHDVYLVTGEYLKTYTQNGTFKWRYKVLPTLINFDQKNNDIIVLNVNGLVALDADTGYVKWKYKENYPISKPPILTQQGNVLLVSGNAIFLLDDKLQKRWTFINPNPSKFTEETRILTIAMTTDGSVYLITDQHKTMYALNPDGTLKWKKTTNYLAPFSNLHIDHADNIYVSNSNGISSIKPNGDLKWERKIDVNSLSIDSTGTLYFDGRPNKDLHYAYALDSNGKLKWQAPLPSDSEYLSMKPTLSSDEKIIYFVTRGYSAEFNNKIVIFNRDGVMKCTIPISDGSAHQSFIAADDESVFYSTESWGDFLASYKINLSNPSH